MDAKYLITISGPSLSGKTTLGRLLEATGDFVEVKSHTTRPPRPGEKYGEDYYFVSEAAFDVMEVCHELIGGTKVGDYRYGTAYSVLERAVKGDKIPFAVTDPQGPRFLHPWCEDNDVTLVACWRHVDTEVQLRRWYDRTSEDPDSLNDSIARLTGIIDREPLWFEEWPWDEILVQQGRSQVIDAINQIRLAVGLEPLPTTWEIPQGIFQED